MAQASQCDPQGGCQGWGGGCGAGRGSETLPLTPSPKPFHSSPGRRFVGLLGKLSLNPLRSSDTADAAHGEAEWTSGEATRVFQPDTLRILPASWRANPGRAGSQLILRIPQTRPKHMLSTEATGQRQGDHHPGDSDTSPGAMLVQGTRRQPGFFHYLMRVHSRPFIHVFTLLLCGLSRNVCNGIFP